MVSPFLAWFANRSIRAGRLASHCPRNLGDDFRNLIGVRLADGAGIGWSCTEYRLHAIAGTDAKDEQKNRNPVDFIFLARILLQHRNQWLR